MNSPRKPWWQQATALVSLGAGGAITGLAFVPGTADQIASPASIPVTLTALDHATRLAAPDDSAVRSAIVGVANYYLRIAQSKTPAEVEALIWQQDSLDGVDHGESCAAFASMTLELGAQLVGRQSWVTGGSTYPWPLHDWADVRVDPNPDSLGITSVLQDAEAHQRWHPLGDGYQPEPGDWVLFNGHVEVVTKYSGRVLSTVGGDSLPNFSVNAHQYPGPLAAQGVAGFVSNGNLPPATGAAPRTSASARRPRAAGPGARPSGAPRPPGRGPPGQPRATWRRFLGPAPRPAWAAPAPAAVRWRSRPRQAPWPGPRVPPRPPSPPRARRSRGCRPPRLTRPARGRGRQSPPAGGSVRPASAPRARGPGPPSPQEARVRRSRGRAPRPRSRFPGCRPRHRHLSRQDRRRATAEASRPDPHPPPPPPRLLALPRQARRRSKHSSIRLRRVRSPRSARTASRPR